MAGMRARTLAVDATLGERAHYAYEQYAELAKARLNTMIVVTTGAGFVMGSSGGGIDWVKLFWTCVGTFLAAAGASALNQRLEIAQDRRMGRTRNRPLVTGAIKPFQALVFGLAASVAGVAILCPTSNGMTAVLGLANIVLYAVVYTLLKRVTIWNTVVGAVVGAIPPMMGWAAADHGKLAAGAWVLGAILFIWQMPHFLALAWMYKEDYAKGGFKMLSVGDATGRKTAAAAAVFSLLLLPIGPLAVWLHLAGICFAVTAIALSIGMLVLAIRFWGATTRDRAKRLFFASLIYLPVVLLVMVADRG